MKNTDWAQLIENAKEERENCEFEGTFAEYLEKVKENPGIVKLAHQRIYELLTKPGVEVIKTEQDPRLKRIYGNDTIKVYNVFKDEFFGMEKVLMKIVRYFQAGAMGGEESRQILTLIGPVGTGKSSIVENLKRLLEEGPPMFVLAGCQMYEEPLHLIPKRLRKQFEQEFKVRIRGEVCPHCNYRLQTEYGGDIMKFPVKTVNFSIMNRIGIGVVPPVDLNNVDTSLLIGSIDISKLKKYPEDHPEVMSLNGACNKGNNGITEFVELFKNPPEVLFPLITATQEGMIQSPGKGPMISYNSVIIGHSNEAGWHDFISDRNNEAHIDRIVRIEVPYCLEASEEERIYNKVLENSSFECHIAPHTLGIAAMFAILTRLAPSNKVKDPLTKLRIYNGEEIVEKDTTKKVDIFELKDEARSLREGMTGISTRFIFKAIDDAITESEHGCINPVDIMKALVTQVKKEDTLPEDEKDKYLGFIQDTLKKEFHRILDKEITKAFVHGYRDKAEALFNKYLDHAEAFTNKTKIKDRSTGEELEPDEKFMQSIEEKIGIVGTMAKGFRQDVTAYMFSVLRKGGTLDLDSYEPLKDAIEKNLTASAKKMTRIISEEAKARDEQQSKQYNAVVQALKDIGYCDHCCNVILKYAANHLWKD